MAGKKTFESEVPWLLDELCVELGFCLPAGERDTLMNAPPRDVDAFTDAVFAAEGIDPGIHKQLRATSRQVVYEKATSRSISI